MTLYLSRLTLNGEASARSLMPLLNPDDPAMAASAHHRLIWHVFSDSHARKRDFLWRHDGKGRFMTLSARPPAGSGLFLPPETKAFEPELRPGDRLRYVLRANATRTRRVDQGRGQRVDVVMDLLHEVPAGTGRAEARPRLAAEAAETWMKDQGCRKGYRPLSTFTEGYSTLELGRKRREGATFGILDLRGEIEITDPAAFLPALAQGFGRAKAWGCGLMLIRRAR